MIKDTKIKNGDLVLYFEGEIDQSKVNSIRSELNSIFKKATVRSVIFNMSNLKFIDSTFIGLIMGRYKELRDKGIPLYIEKPTKQIDKLLKISGIYTIIPLLS